MKKLLPLFLLLLLQQIAAAQCSTPTITASGPTTFCAGDSVTLTALMPALNDGWTKKANLSAVARDGAVGFSIGSKGYIGTGYDVNSSYKKDFWEYDPATNAWTQKADFGGAARHQAVGFSIGSKGYIGTGKTTNNQMDHYQDFWEYDPATNAWTKKADFGGGARRGAVGFSIGSKGYIGTGTNGGHLSDFWEYNPANNTWTKKADFGGEKGNAVGFGIGSKGYIGTGYTNGTNPKKFWEYTPASNTWAPKADYPGTATVLAVGFSIGSNGYIGTGRGAAAANDFWEYNPTTNTWTQKANFGGSARDAAVGFGIGNKGYIGTGGNNIIETDFWEYDPGYLYTWSPDGENTSAIRVKQSGNYTVTVANGSGCSVTSNAVQVTVNASPPEPVVTVGGPATFCAGGSVTLSGPAGSPFYQWSPGGQTTASINATQSGMYTLTVKAASGCSTVSDPIFVLVNAAPAKPVLTNSGPTTFCAGDSVTLSAPAGNAWVQKADFGGTARDGAVGFSIGSKGYIGIGSINNNGGVVKDFWEYDAATNAWTQKADFAGDGLIGAAGLSIGNKGYIGLGQTGSFVVTWTFWEYNPVTNAWGKKANYGGADVLSAVGFSIGGKGYIGTLGTREFWEYDPATDTWTRKADFAGAARGRAVGFGIDSKGYIGTGSNGGNSKQDFWEYDPATNAWTQKADFGGAARSSAAGFSISSKGYIGAGFTSQGTVNDFWEYNPATNTWAQKADLGGTRRNAPTGFSIGSKGYIGTGSTNIFLKDFWEYDPDYTYSWSPGGQTTSSISAKQSDSYTVTVTNAGGCSAVSDPIVVLADTIPKPAVTISGATAFCAGGSVTLSAPAGFASYKWSPGGQTTSSISATQSGNYTVTVANAGGCSAVSDPVAVLSDTISKPTVTASGTLTFCAGGSVTLSAPAGFASYQWSPSGQTTSSIIATQSSNYTVTVASALGCSATSGAVSFDVTATSLALNGYSGTFNVSNGTTTSLEANCLYVGQLTSNGNSPVSGTVNVNAFVENAEPAIDNSIYIRRHVQITPAENAATATGRVTLYALQAEFDSYNINITDSLPTGPGDAAGISRLRVYKYSGASSNGTGGPGTYSGPPTIINPADDDITWNSTSQYWQISFDVTGFSGFFIGAADAVQAFSGSATITAENCTPGDGIIEPGETVTVSFCVQNNSAADFTNLAGTLQNTQGITNASGPQSYGTIQPGASPLCRSFTFTANGVAGDTIQASIKFMAGGNNFITLTKTFILGLVRNTNSSFITIPQAGSASPYPSNINVSGITGEVAKVTVQLTGFSHNYPSDLNILLVSPTGEKVVLMANAGSSTEVINANLVFDDNGASIGYAIPSNTTTIYKPTDNDPGGDFTMPAPAPARPYTTTLSALNGLDPNGTWSLYVADSYEPDGGSFTGGWTLNITPANNCSPLPLKLISFTGLADGNTAQLQWKTTNEQQVSYFEVERSANALYFTKMGQVPAGNSTYHFPDVPGAKAIYYYRLKMVDKDGKYSYSSVVVVNLKTTSVVVKALPNPFSDQLVVNVSATERSQVEVRLTDAGGRTLIRKKANLQQGNNTLILTEVAAFRTGTYILQVVNEKVNQTIKVVKAQ